MSSKLACVAMLGLASIGCTGNGIPPPSNPDLGPVDLGSHDSAVHVGDIGPLPDMGPGVDAFGLDAAGLDAPGLDAPGLDAPSANDASVDSPDLGPRPDTSACFLVDGAYDLCSCGPLTQDCSTTACPTGQTCTPDICGRHCVPSGSGCAGPSDCPSGSSCTAGVCVSGSACSDSRDCPLGYACEGVSCVDRRIPCSTEGNCPFGYACDTMLGLGTCIRASRPCSTDAACNDTFSAQQVCVDIDGDGTTECQFAGGQCMTNADCHIAGVVCAPHALTELSVCGRFGPCNLVSDCGPGMDCVDLWGDGLTECVLTGGSCVNSSVCPVHQVCATPAGGGPPMCLSSG